MKDRQNILVVGSEGFIGRHICEFYKNKGHNIYKVGTSESKSENYFKVDVCINASGSASVGYSLEDPVNDFNLNTVNVYSLLAGIKDNCPECKFVTMSSAAVYGNVTELPIKEEFKKEPLSPYGWHKLYSEQIIKEFANYFKIKTLGLRIFSVYGPGLNKQLFYDLYNKCKEAKSLELFGTGEESRDFIYIDDFINALDLCLNKMDFNGESINVGVGKEYIISDVARIFSSYVDEQIEVNFNGEFRKGDPQNWQADISKLNQVGFQQSIGIKEGLKKTVEYYRENEKA